MADRLTQIAQSTPTRRATVEVVYNGKDISGYVMPYLESFDYIDNAGDKADTVTVTVADPGYWWRDKSQIGAGDKIVPRIILTNWFETGDRRELRCGNFKIDQPGVFGPPPRMTISAASVTISKAIRRESHSQTWESISLKTIAARIAARHGLKLYWEGTPPQLDRKTQANEPDLPFLRRLCTKYGFNLKVDGEKLIIYHVATREQMPGAATVSADLTTNYSFAAQAHKAAAGCRVSYWDPIRKDFFAYTYKPEGAPTVGRMIWIDARARGRAEARTIAQARLSGTNGRYIKGSVTTFGNPALRAGLTCNLSGFGTYDGLYFIDRAEHRVAASGRYTTDLSIRRGKEST